MMHPLKRALPEGVFERGWRKAPDIDGDQDSQFTSFDWRGWQWRSGAGLKPAIRCALYESPLSRRSVLCRCVRFWSEAGGRC